MCHKPLGELLIVTNFSSRTVVWYVDFETRVAIILEMDCAASGLFRKDPPIEFYTDRTCDLITLEDCHIVQPAREFMITALGLGTFEMSSASIR